MTAQGNRRFYSVTGLGFGDEGKGSIVDSLAQHTGVQVIVRATGGPQAAHNVHREPFPHHCFHQLGSGMLLPGRMTMLTGEMLISPEHLLLERSDLSAKLGHAGFSSSSIMVDTSLQVITPWHTWLSQWNNWHTPPSCRHGSCGFGVGLAREIALKRPDMVIRVRDLQEPDTYREKTMLLARCVHDLAHQLGDPGDSWEKLPLVHKPGHHLLWQDGDHCKQVANSFRKACLLAPPEFFLDFLKPDAKQERNGILPADHRVIFEGAQGVMLDEDYGLHPFTTWSRVTDRPLYDLLERAGWSHTNLDDPRNLLNLGVTRSVTTRHGHGPMPGESRDDVLRGSRAKWHEFENNHAEADYLQGSFRWGWLDLALLRYAANTAMRNLSGLVVTHMDMGGDYDFQILDSGVDEDLTAIVNQHVDLQSPEALAERAALSERLLLGWPSGMPVFAGIAHQKLLGSLEHMNVWDRVDDGRTFPIMGTSFGPRPRDKYWFEWLT